jgi:3-oxoacyl-[acyl-carrier protein] reductase
MRFASEYWRNRSKEVGDAGYGRIINTSSEAFIFGSPGQPNYAAAKAGIVAMTMCAAQTLAKYGVTANAIMPRARTRMNDSGILAAMFAKPADGFDTFAPENVSPLVAFLASPRAAAVNGYVMIVWGKEIVMVDKPGTDTKFVSEAPWTVDAVERKLVPYASAREPIFGGFTVKPA